MISHSSAEAEYRALTTSTAKITWIYQLLHDLSLTISLLSLLFCDNQATM